VPPAAFQIFLVAADSDLLAAAAPDLQQLCMLGKEWSNPLRLCRVAQLQTELKAACAGVL
jgi:hypothetical protein